MKYLKAAYYFFPIQLLLLTFRRYPVFLLEWLFLFGVVTGTVGTTYGAFNIVCDPEYLGHTGYLSFVLVGAAFGVFYIAWNLNCYLLHSQRFPFLANDFRPMGTFFLNNSVIPAVFIVVYFRNIIYYQSQYENTAPLYIAFDILGFIAGALLILLLTAIYYSFTNRDKLRKDDLMKKRFRFLLRQYQTFSLSEFETIKVNTLLLQNLKLQSVWELQPKDYEDARIIFRQHHINVFVAQTAILLLIFGLGFVVENPLFQLPVACTSFLFFAALISVLGAMIYWTGKWSLVLIVLFFIFLNNISQYNFFGYRSAAYGLNYELPEKRPYNIKEIRALASDSNIHSDIAYFKNILNNWKRKQKTDKPKLIFVNTSGGGSRSAMFTAAVLQNADSLLNGQLFDKVFLMSGASGGMFGVAEMRELFLEKKLGSQINLYDRKYPYELAADLLNPMFVSLLSNDLVSPVHYFTFDGMRYSKDRGYMMEQQLIKNLEGRLDNRLIDYKSFEYNALVPLIIAHTTVVGDSRRFYMSPHPVRFLMRQRKEYQSNTYPEIDAIDFCRFFEKEGAENMRFTSALRMSATFPFILPNTELPTNPPMIVMDGGASDNYGAETTIRFIQTFREWINDNTSGVVIIQIRDTKKEDDIEPVSETTIDRLMNPIGQFIFNMDDQQDYRIDQQLNFTNLTLSEKIQMITFEYAPEKKEEKAAMSLHLTEREKKNIISSLKTPNNQFAFRLLGEWADN